MTYLYKSFSLAWKKEKLWLIITILNSILTGFIPLVSVWILENLVTSITILIQNNSANYLEPLFWLLIQFLITVFSAISEKYQEFIDRKAEEKLELSLQQNVLIKTTSVPITYFDLPDFYNKLSRVNGYLGGKFLNPLKSIMAITRDSITLISLISYLLSIHWSLSLISLLAALPILLIQTKFGKKQYWLFFFQTPINKELEYIKFILRERNFAKEIRIFSLGFYFIREWTKKYEGNLKELLKLLKRRQIASVSSDILSAAFYLFACFIIINLIRTKLLTIGVFIAVGQAFQRAQSAVNSISRQFASLNEQSLYIQDYFNFIDFKDPNIPELKGEEFFPSPLKKGIFLENVSFSYINGNRQILKDLSLHISPGEKIAIVGENGSGKTTFVKCLMGLYPVSKGKIYFDDIELNEISQQDLFRYITVIFQDFIKYGYTVRENISFGDISNDNLDEIKKVAEKAGIHEFVNQLENGYNTYLGKAIHEGVDLSGGQWQKIALARALFRKGEIFILDEPTASLDPQAELDVFKKFETLTKDKTTLFISHRMASAKIADRIIVFKDGNIVEIGTHDELMAIQEEYYRLYTIQSELFDLQTQLKKVGTSI